MKPKLIFLISLLTVLAVVSFSDAALRQKVKVKLRIISQSIGDAQLKDNAISNLRVIADDLITGSKIKNETIKNEDIATDANIDRSKLNIPDYPTNGEKNKLGEIVDTSDSNIAIGNKNISQIHDQNTDTSTNSNTFTIGQTGNDVTLLFGTSAKSLTYDKTSENFKLSKPLSLETNKITNIATPTNDTDATNKAYVDNQLSVNINNLKWKDPVNSHSDLPTCNSSSDGHSRLVKDENWIYRCDNSDNTWHKVANVATVNHNDLQNRDVSSSHPSTAISFTPTTQIAATNTQTAITELSNETVHTDPSSSQTITYQAPTVQTILKMASSQSASPFKILNNSDNSIFSVNTSGIIETASVNSASIVDGTITGTDLKSDISITTTGSITASSVSASTLTSTALTGTPPLAVTSTTKVANLNVDLLDNMNTSATGGNSVIPVTDGSGNFSLGAGNITTTGNVNATTATVTTVNATNASATTTTTTNLNFADSTTQTTAAINTTFRHGDGRVNDYYCQQKSVSSSGQVGDWTNINNSNVCGFNKRCDGSGNCVTSDFICGTSQVMDAENNTYDTVLIGNQCWMKQNLKLGTMLASGSTSPIPNNGTIEKWCYANDPNNCTAYGGLYSWSEAMNDSIIEGAQGICPASWHIPTDAQQYELENYLKDTPTTSCVSTRTGWDCSSAGTKLQSGGSSNFTGLLAGDRGTDGTFSGLGSDASFWSSSQSGTSAWNRYLNSSYATVFRNLSSEAYGFSVRCLKN